MLLQADVNSNIFRPVAFHSRKLSSAEKNYPTREQELLALVDSVKHWRHYHKGSPKAANSSVSASTGLAPFEISYGENVRLRSL